MSCPRTLDLGDLHDREPPNRDRRRRRDPGFLARHGNLALDGIDALDLGEQHRSPPELVANLDAEARRV